MTKTLKDLFELYVATSTKNDKDFLSPQHTVQKHADRNGNGDDVFTGSNVKTAKRAPDHGYDADDDVKAHIGKNSVPKEQGHVREEVEQIDELSKSTVRSYLSKSDKDLDDTLLTKAGTPKPKISDEDSHRVSKRLKGGAMASKRLYTAEDTDVVESAFNRYVAGRTDAAPRKSKLEENLSVVAPKTRDSILAMYETLSVENQDVMLDLSESIEGINELVDFVITNGEL